MPNALVPPHNLEAEQSVLGACLLGPDIFQRVSLLLTPKDFYSAKNAEVFASMTEARRSGLKTDVVTVANRLVERNTLEQVGGRAYLMELTCVVAVPDEAKAVDYAKIVYEDARRRRLIETAAVLSEVARDERPIKDVLAKATEVVLPNLYWSDDHQLLDSKGAMDRFYDSVESGISESIPTGWPTLDAFFQGFRRGELTFIAARPAVGKSQVLLNLMASMCRRGKKCLFISLEMSAEEVMDRLIAQVSVCPINAVRRPQGSMLTEVSNAAGKITEWGMMLDDDPRLNIQGLYAKIKEAKERMGALHFVFVDYLGLMDMSGRGEMWEKIINLSREMKVLAKSEGINVVMAHQINRDAEKSRDGRPKLHHLSSGSVEKDADHVFMLYRPSMDPNLKQDEIPLDARIEIEIILEKNRHGPLGTAKLRFDGATSRVVEWRGPTI